MRSRGTSIRGDGSRSTDSRYPAEGTVAYALIYVLQQNMRNAGEPVVGKRIDACGKAVVVIGSGDSASDCIGTAFRQSARSVTEIDVHAMSPRAEDMLMSWPFRPLKYSVSSSQAEGAARTFQTGAIELIGCRGSVTAVRCARIDAERRPIPGTQFGLPVELVLVAIGSSGPDVAQIVRALGPALEAGANISASARNYATYQPGVFPRAMSARAPPSSFGRSARDDARQHRLTHFFSGWRDLRKQRHANFVRSRTLVMA